MATATAAADASAGLLQKFTTMTTPASPNRARDAITGLLELTCGVSFEVIALTQVDDLSWKIPGAVVSGLITLRGLFSTVTALRSQNTQEMTLEELRGRTNLMIPADELVRALDAAARSASPIDDVDDDDGGAGAAATLTVVTDTTVPKAELEEAQQELSTLRAALVQLNREMQIRSSQAASAPEAMTELAIPSEPSHPLRLLIMRINALIAPLQSMAASGGASGANSAANTPFASPAASSGASRRRPVDD